MVVLHQFILLHFLLSKLYLTSSPPLNIRYWITGESHDWVEKTESLKGSVVNKQGWGEVHHFVNNWVSKQFNSLRTFLSMKLQRIYRFHHLVHNIIKRLTRLYQTIKPLDHFVPNFQQSLFLQILRWKGFFTDWLH